MMLLRFMSAAEALKLQAGQTIRNSTIHNDQGQATNSIGFCFTIAGDQDTANEIYLAAMRLSGVATMDICLFALLDPKPKRYQKTWGHYKTGDLPEISVQQYKLADFDDWAFFTGHDRSPLAPMFSGNWTSPRNVTKKET